jgi:hypothetical protein
MGISTLQPRRRATSLPFGSIACNITNSNTTHQHHTNTIFTNALTPAIQGAH